MLKFKHFIKSEDTSWITFVHGAGGSSTIWHKQVKVLKEHFNLLLIDLRGHGMSNDLPVDNDYSLEMVVDEVVDVIQHLKIKRSHFIGVSLGTIIITKISELYPKIVDKVILSGAITSFSTRTLFLLRTAQLIKSFTPNIVLYRLFALIIMPSKEHRVSRRIFINEAKKIKNKAFKNWLRLLPEIKHTIDDISKLKLSKPTLFISGIEDYLFVRQIEEYVKDKSNCFLEKINNSGHIVNIDQYQTFNKVALKFLK
ncbi:alpha/beta hydrolase [Flavobacteriales bacterium]|nr:alpha/beta hydrolase [Flavobacteriales bacterium]